MSALTSERLTPKLGSGPMPDLVTLPVKASTKIYQGALVVMNSSGVALGGTTATGHIAVGRAETTVDNSSGSDGTLNITVRQGVFKFNNSTSTDAIAAAQIGTDCYIVDDNTVAKTNGTSTRSRAGKVIRVDSDGVYVQIAIGLLSE